MITKAIYFPIYIVLFVCLGWLLWRGLETTHKFIMERQSKIALAQSRRIAVAVQEAKIAGITNIYVGTVVQIKIIIQGEVGTVHELERLRAIIAEIHPSVPVSMRVSIVEDKSVYSETNTY